MSDELTFSASDNDVTPESPIPFQMGYDSIIINYNLISISSSVSDEFTFNASDNDVAPESPILLQMECD